MDHAEQLALEKTLPQVIAGRWLFMDCVIACGDDHLAGLALSHLLHWWPHKYACHKGVKKSVADWKTECRLSKDQMNRINKILTGCGFVEIYQDKWGKFKSPSNFYVMTDKALALLKPYAGNPPMVSVPQAGNPHTPQVGKPSMVDTPQAGNPAVTEITKNPTENTKVNTKSAQALPDAMLTGETSKAPQAESKAKTATLKISVEFESLFKKEFPTLYIPLNTTDREILGSALHALCDSGEEDYRGCLLFAATEYGYGKFQGLCNAAGVFPPVKTIPEPKRIRENLGYLRQVYQAHLKKEQAKIAPVTVAAPVVPKAKAAPKLTPEQKTIKSIFCNGYTDVQKSGQPITPDVEHWFQKLQGPLTDAEWKELGELVCAPTEPADSTPAEVVAPASAPEPEQAATGPVIEPPKCPQSAQDEEEEAPELLRLMGKDAISRPIPLDALKKYLEAANAEAMKKALEDAKKPKSNIHA